MNGNTSYTLVTSDFNKQKFESNDKKVCQQWIPLSDTSSNIEKLRLKTIV